MSSVLFALKNTNNNSCYKKIMGHSSCCVVNCNNTGRNSKCKFYRFPIATWKLEQRKKWIAAVKRNNTDETPWYPKPFDLICSDHFVGGKKSDELTSPSYIPTIFPSKISNESVARDGRFMERRRNKEVPNTILYSIMKNEDTLRVREHNYCVPWSEGNGVGTLIKSAPECCRPMQSVQSFKRDLLSELEVQSKREPESTDNDDLAQLTNVGNDDINPLDDTCAKEWDVDMVDLSKHSDYEDSGNELCENGVENTVDNLSNEEDIAKLHEGFKCNECGASICGFRYTCVECADYDLCASCEARGSHARHYVLRVPGPRPYWEIQSMLNVLRQKLCPTDTDEDQNLTSAIDNLISGIKIELEDEESLDQATPEVSNLPSTFDSGLPFISVTGIEQDDNIDIDATSQPTGPKKKMKKKSLSKEIKIIDSGSTDPLRDQLSKKRPPRDVMKHTKRPPDDVIKRTGSTLSSPHKPTTLYIVRNLLRKKKCAKSGAEILNEILTAKAYVVLTRLTQAEIDAVKRK